MTTKNLLLAAAILVAAPAFAQEDTTATEGHHAVSLTLGTNGADVKLIDTRDSTQIVEGYDTLRLETKRKHITILFEPKPMSSADSLPSLLKELRRKRRSAFTHWGGMDLGLNSFIATDGRFGDGPETNGLALNNWRSRFLAFNVAEWKVEFGSHHAGLLTGLGVEFRNYHFADNTVLTDVADTTWGVPVTDPDFTKNKLRQIGLRVPLMLEFNTKRAPMPTTIEEAVAQRKNGFSNKNNFHLAFGVVGSWYFDTMYKQKYNDEGNEKKLRSKDDFNLLPYNLAATVRIGFGDLTLFAEYSLTTLFKDGGSPELVPVAIGVQLLDFEEAGFQRNKGTVHEGSRNAGRRGNVLSRPAPIFAALQRQHPAVAGAPKNQEPITHGPSIRKTKAQGIFARNAKLSKLFTRIGKEIAMAVKAGGPNPDANTRLRMAVQNARGMNMPKDNVDRAIKKAAAGGEGADYAEVTYEGYAPGGIAIFVDAATNNTTRTVANVRSFFTKCEGTLGTNGSLSHVFERKGEFVVENAALKGRDGDEFEMECIDAGADDVHRDEEGFIILTPFQGFGAMQQKLEELGIDSKSAELKRYPLSMIPADLTTARNVMKLVDMLDEDEDVNAVYHNMELSEEVEAELAKG